MSVKRETGSRDSNSIASSITYQDDTPASLEKTWSDNEIGYDKYSMTVDNEPRIKLENHDDGYTAANSLLKEVWQAVDDVRCSL
jgi:hypothetical protein